MQEDVKQFPCPHCDKSYSRQDHIKEHLEKKHEVKVSKRPKNFYCPFNCQDGPFCTLTDLLAHSRAQHDSDLGMTMQQSKQLS